MIKLTNKIIFSDRKLKLQRRIGSGLPKVEVGWTVMSCHCETVETLIVIMPSAASWMLSLFWTSMPPGLTSHLISPMFLQSLSVAVADADADAALFPLPSLEVLLLNLFDLNFIIFLVFAVFSLCEGEEMVRELGKYIMLQSLERTKKVMNTKEAALVLRKSQKLGFS